MDKNVVVHLKEYEFLKMKLRQLEKFDKKFLATLQWTALLLEIIGERYTIRQKTFFAPGDQIIYIGILPQNLPKRDKYMMNVLLKNCWAEESPTLNGWMDITMNICSIEKSRIC